jgi:hypothetical protein
MGLVTLAKGFKISVAKFDGFLSKNGLAPTYGYRPLRDATLKIGALFRRKGVDSEVKVFAGYSHGFSPPHHVFVCFDWAHVFVARALEDLQRELQKPVPAGFEEIRQLLEAESEISTYIIYNSEEDWVPEEVRRRHEVCTPEYRTDHPLAYN